MGIRLNLAVFPASGLPSPFIGRRRVAAKIPFAFYERKPYHQQSQFIATVPSGQTCGLRIDPDLFKSNS